MLLCSLTHSSSAALSKNVRKNVRRRVLHETRDGSQCLPCHLVRMELEDTGDEEDTPLTCIVQNNYGYKSMLDVTALPSSFLSDADNNIRNGSAHTCIPLAHIDWEQRTVTVPETVGLELHYHSMEHGRRLNAKGRSNKPVLAIRVLGKDGNERPTEGTDLISRTIFESTNSVVNQYRRVSHGALNLGPATGVGIENGVAEMTLDSSFEGGNIRLLSTQMIEQAESQFGSFDNFYHVVFCVPEGSTLSGRTSWTAFTFLFEDVSQRRWGIRVQLFSREEYDLTFLDSFQSTNNLAVPD